MTDPVRVTPVCPFVGLPDDPQSHFSFPEPAHLCRAKDKPAKVDLSFQASFCLGSSYQQCQRYRTATRPVPLAVGGASVGAGAANALATAPNEPLKRSRRTISYLAGLLVALLALLALGSVAVLLGFSFAPPVTAEATPTATAVVVVIASSTAETSPTPPPTLAVTPPPTPALPTPAPTPTPIPAATPAPTATPTPTPTPLIHVVAKGETIRSIAHDYGVGWRSIIEANGITDPNLIWIGEELIIPLE